jgi:hypothetical protein
MIEKIQQVKELLIELNNYYMKNNPTMAECVEYNNVRISIDGLDRLIHNY